MENKINIKDLIVKTQVNKDKLSTSNEADMVFVESSDELIKKPFRELMHCATDYAVMNGVAVNRKVNDQLGNVGVGGYWLSSQSTYENKAQSIYNNYGALHFLDFHQACSQSVGVCPAINLDLEKLMQAMKCNPDLMKIDVAKDKDGKEIYHTINFGSYPKTRVSSDLAIELQIHLCNDTLKKTGKTYTGCVNPNSPSTFYENVEYEYKNEKYVRVLTKCAEESTYSNGIIAKNETYEWVKVEPIIWEIKNWEDMPKKLNQFGNGSATTLQLRSQDVIMGGIPFYPLTRSNQASNAWKDSMIRAFLNSSNTCTYNPNKYNFLLDPNFEGKGFLSNAFDQEINYEEIKSNTSRKNNYGIEIIDEPMSVEEQIKFYIDNGKSFMLHGASGVGKTRRIEEADPDYVSIVLRNGILPEEVIGKTIFPNDDKKLGGVWSPPAWYVSLCEKCEKEPDKNHVLFIDEITNVKPSEQSLVFHLVLNNSIGPNIGQLPKNVVVVAAGNTKEESEAAYNMPEPLYRRFEGHIELRPEVQKFLEWGSEKSKKGEDRLKVHPIVAAFVGTYGDDVFYSPYDSEEPPKFAIDPRGWEQVSDIIYDNKGVIRRELIENKVGHQIASAFMAFAKNPPLTLCDVLNKTYTKEDIPTTFDAKYALALSLRCATEQEIKVVREFIKNELGNEILSMFDSLWIGEDSERAIAISQCEERLLVI